MNADRMRSVIAALLALSLVAVDASPAVGQLFQVTGRFEYLDKEWGWNGWTGEQVARPIRRADVYVLNNLTGLVLGSGSTGQDGSFSITASIASLVDVVVRCDADSDLDGNFQRVRVTTQGNVEYAVFSPVTLLHNPLLPLDIGTVTAGPVTTGGLPASPFNMFDMAVAAAEYVTGPVIGAAPTPTVWRVYWPGGGGSYAIGNQAFIADDDGDDDAVVLHELGHVVHNLYSHSDSPGGPHWFGDSDQDPRLSFGEGYATFFAGAVLMSLGREAIYQDATAAATLNGSQLRLRLETVAPYAAGSFGAADEVAVACVLHDLIDSHESPDETPGFDDDPIGAGTLVAGLTPQRAWWAVFTGPVKTASQLTLNDAWDGWHTLFAPDPLHSEVRAIFENRRMNFWNDAGEPDNSPAQATPLPAVVGTQWLTGRTLYSAPAPPFAPGSGDEDWYATPLVKGSVVAWRTRYPNNAGDADTQCDPYIEVYSPDLTLEASAEDGGTGRNALVDEFTITETGTWLLRVTTTSSLRRYGGYEVRCRYLFQNHAPQIVQGPSASPEAVMSGQTALLQVTATDANAGQTLSYDWEPLDGGEILGEGDTVEFLAPAVAAPTRMRVALVVSDDLGAQSAPVEVELTVVPVEGGVCSLPASVVPGGVGKPGVFGIPALSALGQPVVPSQGLSLHVAGGHPLLPAQLVFGFSLISASFDLGKLYPTPDLMLPVALDVNGKLALPLALPAEPLLCGVTLYLQLIVPGDPGATGDRQTAQSNFLAVTFGD